MDSVTLKTRSKKGLSNVRGESKSLKAGEGERAKGKWLHLMNIHTTLQLQREGRG